MGRNVTLLAPNTAFTPDDMPLIGGGSGTLSSGSVYYKVGMNVLGSLRGYFGAIFTYISVTNKNGATVQTPSANTWYTIVSTTGTSGGLVNVFTQAAFGAYPIVDIEVTIDGTVYTYTRSLGNSTGGMRLCLGALLLSGTTPTTTTALSTQETQFLPASYNDVGFGSGANYYFEHPLQAISNGRPYVKWKKSLLIRVRSSTTPAPYSSNAASSTAVATFTID